MDFECQARSIFWVLPGVLFLRMALNAIDGIMAREFGQQSALGAYLNELADVVSDTFLYVPFAFLGIFDSWEVAAVILLSVISEMTGIAAVMAGASRRYDGPMGKSDRAFVFGALAIWLGGGRAVAPWVAQWLPLGLGALVVLTIVNRIKKGLEEYAQTNRAALQF
jgi:CDP-diacylglycerol--glycerol-3-phosphate 3-phosphatidyltransferase